MAQEEAKPLYRCTPEQIDAQDMLVFARRFRACSQMPAEWIERLREKEAHSLANLSSDEKQELERSDGRVVHLFRWELSDTNRKAHEEFAGSIPFTPNVTPLYYAATVTEMVFQGMVYKLNPMAQKTEPDGFRGLNKKEEFKQVRDVPLIGFIEALYPGILPVILPKDRFYVCPQLRDIMLTDYLPRLKIKKTAEYTPDVEQLQAKKAWIAQDYSLFGMVMRRCGFADVQDISLYTDVQEKALCVGLVNKHAEFCLSQGKPQCKYSLLPPTV
jgi:hypothetical protein